MPETGILIICFSFPPYPGIGGRRWAKFAREIARNDNKVFVVNARNTFSKNSIWTKDVLNENINTRSFYFNFQKILLDPGNFFEKIFRKAIIFISRSTKYTPDMPTSYPNNSVWKEVETLISKERIKKVIVSGDPYLFYYCALLKKRIQFELILDYRDLWNDHSFYRKNVQLSGSQREFFECAENYAVNNCDKILCVDVGLEKKIKARVTNNAIKTCVIPNGYDPEEFTDKLEGKRPENKLKIFFAGNISSDVNALFIKFVAALSELKNHDRDLYNKISLEIIGNMDEALITAIKHYDLENVSAENRFMDFEAYKAFISERHIGIIHLSDEYADSFATKFGDFLMRDVFVLSLGSRGAFAEHIEKNKTGLHFDVEETPGFFERLDTAYKSREIADEQTLSDFNIKNITHKLLKTIDYA